MPSYLDFDTTKKFRDELLKRTLDPIYGNETSPKNFNHTNYSVQKLSDSSNILQPQVDANRSNDLLTPQKFNIFKPSEYFIKDTIVDIPRRANLSLYPYFTPTTDTNLISIINASNFNTESELFKFAVNNIKTNPYGLILSRTQQNLDESTNAVNNIGNTLSGNSGLDLYNIISGFQPLKAGTDKITVNSNTTPPTIDFIGTVQGTTLPFDLIPGNYLTNPNAPINVRPTDVSATTKVWQDLTGVLGSIVGIQRRPLPTRKPSDLLIENMGESSKYRLFNLLRYSKYAPNYTITAMSQQSSLLFNIPDMIAQGINTVLDEGAPAGVAYMGDDRSNDVKNQTNDIFSGRPVRSSYYLSLMFDPVATDLFHEIKPITEGGSISGKLTWMSSVSKSGISNNQYIGTTNSNGITFRPDSILDVTQQILNSKPKTGGDEARSHIGHILDQTSTYFKDGKTNISRGSGVMYIDNSGKDIGVQYARVWTKDKPYLTNADTMPLYKETTNKPYYSGTTTPYRRTGIRRFDGSVMTNPWNLNIAPMSDGTANSKSFDNSSNIVKNPQGTGFYAKKYMLSIENLAWKTSTIPGYTVNDLPYSERGPNGGRVMWFPPYDMKISEQNSAKWEPNSFLGRPEPIYTYQNTERTGQLSFKVVVDHPSILNLLVREHFKSVSEDDVQKYFDAFFAGAKDLDFYSLIRTYSNLDSNDIQLIQDYLNSNGDPNTVNQYKNAVSSPVVNNPSGTNADNLKGEPLTVKLNFNNSDPIVGTDNFTSTVSYENIINTITGITKNVGRTEFQNALNDIVISGNTSDSTVMFGKKTLDSSESGTTINKVMSDYDGIFSNLNSAFNDLKNKLLQLKNDLSNKIVSGDIFITIGSSTTLIGDSKQNAYLSVRRSNALYQFIFNTLSNGKTPNDTWSAPTLPPNQVYAPGQEKYSVNPSYKVKDFGYDGDINILFRTTNYGSNANTENGNCGTISFIDPRLTDYSTLSYGCRASTVTVDYKTVTKTQPSIPANAQQLTTGGRVPNKTNKPSIDVMKRIIMKTLSEEYYFKKLEETSPIAFSSLKEKLKYFHPGFHSMTPEGLNSRLTFLQQCLRPGNTIPVKGVSDNSDIDARNTTFGPPPICVLRVGDFYNSKIVIKDLNIQFEENTWDLNPEGIGVQPMIADVTLQINFIGGQGLERPIERLQNALSSNFYANTEMYDERSEETTTSIGGQTGNTFTKSFLESLNAVNALKSGLKDSNGKGLVEGKYIGNGNINGNSLVSIDYSDLVTKVYKSTADYFNQYQDTYNSVLTTYGSLVTNLIFNQSYRGISTYTLYNGTSSSNLYLFGVYPNQNDLGTLLDNFKKDFTKYLSDRTDNKGYSSILDILKLSNVVDNNNSDSIGEAIYNFIMDTTIPSLDDLLTLPNISKYEGTRNVLISSLDGLNFVNEHNYDIKLTQGNTYKATFSGYTNGDLFNQYKQCTDYISSNTTKMYSKLNTTIDFSSKNTQFMSPTDDDFDPNIQDLLQTLLYGSKTQLISDLNVDYSTDVTDPISEKLDSVLYQEKPVNFKFPKLPVQKNNNIVNYAVASEMIDTTTDEIKKLLGSQNTVSTISDTLNYYKP